MDFVSNIFEGMLLHFLKEKIVKFLENIGSCIFGNGAVNRCESLELGAQYSTDFNDDVKLQDVEISSIKEFDANDHLKFGNETKQDNNLFCSSFSTENKTSLGTSTFLFPETNDNVANTTSDEAIEYSIKCGDFVGEEESLNMNTMLSSELIKIMENCVNLNTSFYLRKDSIHKKLSSANQAARVHVNESSNTGEVFNRETNKSLENCVSLNTGFFLRRNCILEDVSSSAESSRVPTHSKLQIGVEVGKVMQNCVSLNTSFFLRRNSTSNGSAQVQPTRKSRTMKKLDRRVGKSLVHSVYLNNAFFLRKNSILSSVQNV